MFGFMRFITDLFKGCPFWFGNESEDKKELNMFQDNIDMRMVISVAHRYTERELTAKEILKEPGYYEIFPLKNK